MRSVGADSFLLQERDLKTATRADLKIVTKRQPTEAELSAMLFGWRVVKHVKSNAIVYAGADRTLGIGAGQMSRVDSSRIAVWKAGEAKLPLKGSVVCSDAFFPFPDGLIAAAEAGATAAIQPGGSVKDAEVIAAADERGIWRWRSPARGISGIELGKEHKKFRLAGTPVPPNGFSGSASKSG